MERLLITGSGGLVGNEAVEYFCPLSSQIVGIDDNSRGRWFGQTGSTDHHVTNNIILPNYHHEHLDICNVQAINDLIQSFLPTAIIHCAAQPSHEKSAEIPFEDFQINTVGTINLLEATRKFVPNSPFIFMSTNKVYGDAPNQLERVEHPARFDFIFPGGIDETMSIDQCLHSPFGANKAAADLIVQEYGRYYNMNTVCFRCGCITGKNHQGVEQHGFLSHLCKTAKNNLPYTIYGHRGKQVRDNIHAYDLVSAFHEYLLNPKTSVYNMGGGIDNSCSVLEAIDIVKHTLNIEIKTYYEPARKGDHICYYTNFEKFAKDYPNWQISLSLQDIFEDLLN